MSNSDPSDRPPQHWLNKTVVGAGITSLLADVCYEMAAAVLPSFMLALSLPATLLGIVEGTADATSNFAKLGVGWLGDRLGRRKPFVILGYALTGLSQALMALGWPMILVAKVIGWFGKGVRSPLRNAILADAVPAEHRGKAFGFHRAGDTIGAILGPLAGFALLRWLPTDWFSSPIGSYRLIFLLTLIPGIGSVLAFALLVKEKPNPSQPQLRLWGSIRAMPRDFRRFLAGVGVFGLGDCSDKLLVLAATEILSPSMGARDAASTGILLYAWRNVVQAATAYPIGAISDRVGPRKPLLVGYLIGVITMLGFAASGTALLSNSSVIIAFFVVIFTLAGTYLSTEEALESVLTANLVPDRSVRGTAFGILGSVNGVGDLVSSLVVGLLIQHVSISAGFLYAAALMILGSILLVRVR
jgi:MFS family permease